MIYQRIKLFQIEKNIFNNNDIKYNKRNFENFFNIINMKKTLKVILSLNQLFLQMKKNNNKSNQIII
jgi:hypothetical protein